MKADSMRNPFAAAVLLPLLLVGGTADAARLDVDIEIPTLEVAEYHRPYVALWLEREDNSVAAQLAVWYDLEMADREGETWLKDMRQWWRRDGRNLQMPIDGVSGATRAPGRHRLGIDGDDPRLSGLAPGNYQLVVEAAREVGGRELLRLPLSWPPAGPVTTRAAGEHELGTVILELAP
jgi:hypothetical protein